MKNTVKINIFLSALALFLFWLLVHNSAFGLDLKIIEGDIKIYSNWFWAISLIGIMAILFGILGLFAFDHNPIAGKAVTLISMVLYFATAGMYFSFLILNELFFPLFWILPVYLMAWPILLIPSHICEIAPKKY